MLRKDFFCSNVSMLCYMTTGKCVFLYSYSDISDALFTMVKPRTLKTGFKRGYIMVHEILNENSLN